MHSKQHFPNVIFGESLRPQGAALAIMLMLLFLLFVLVFMTLIAQPARAQTFTVLHAFTGGVDGAQPWNGLTMDNAGNLYGTTPYGGSSGCEFGCGTVFRLSKKGSGWVFNPLYDFQGGSDGANPGEVVFGPDGGLYGTTLLGGSPACMDGCGTVFNLRPPATACKTALCPWTETLVYQFAGGPDGAGPEAQFIFDQAGNMYGTTGGGGPSDGGTVYELMPSGSGWTLNTLHDFDYWSDGSQPVAGVIFDKVGNLYGTTSNGGPGGWGTAFQLTYVGGLGWTVNILHSFGFGNDGRIPYAGLIFDQSGNLYGATANAGPDGGGTVFELTPSNGSWTYSLVYSFTGGYSCGPWGSLVIDPAGNLYGTTRCDDPNGYGSVFKLTSSGGGWTYTSLHDFTNYHDGYNPIGRLLLDASGNLYGTSRWGGTGCDSGCGVIWEITP